MRDGFGHVPAPSLRRRLLRHAQVGLCWTCVAGLYRWLGRPRSLCVLMYHSVAGDGDGRWIAPRNRIAPRRFEAQMRFLARHRRVISLPALLDMIRHHEPIQPGTVLLTFDDGYRDSLYVAAPILQRYRLPAVLYLCTGYISRGQNQWADVLYSAIRCRRRDRLAVQNEPPFDLTGPAGRQAAYRAVADRLLAVDYATRDALLNDVVGQLQPDEQPPRQTLTWAEVRHLSGHYPDFTLGVHTADHLDLSSMSVDAAVGEVHRSAEQFEAEMGRRPEHFSFPYSRAVPRVSQRLGEMGFRSVATTEGTMDRTSPNPMDLRRLEAPQGRGLLRYWTSGAHPHLSLKLFGRA